MATSIVLCSYRFHYIMYSVHVLHVPCTAVDLYAYNFHMIFHLLIVVIVYVYTWLMSVNNERSVEPAAVVVDLLMPQRWKEIRLDCVVTAARYVSAPVRIIHGNLPQALEGSYRHCMFVHNM